MDDSQKVTSMKPVENGRNYGGDKEMVFAASVIGVKNGEMKELVVVRGWMGRSRQASKVYTTVWVHGGGVYAAGHGTAGGYGYHKPSAALEHALSSAGIELKHAIGGRGDGAMQDALLAVGRKLGYRKLIYVSHGA